MPGQSISPAVPAHCLAWLLSPGERADGDRGRWGLGRGNRDGVTRRARSRTLLRCNLGRTSLPVRNYGCSLPQVVTPCSVGPAPVQDAMGRCD
jgi:hypothetical protein